MKKIYLLLLMASFSYSINAQTVNVLEALGTTQNVILGFSNYNVTEAIYSDAELGTGNFIGAGDAIQKLGFFVETEGPTTNVTNLRVWMQNVTPATTTLASGVYSTAGYTQVYFGSYTATAGLSTITLTTPFARTAGSNLKVLIERVDNVVYTGAVMYAAAGLNGDGVTVTCRRYNNTTAPVSGVTSLTQSAFRPAMQFVHTFPIDAGIVGFGAPLISCYDAPQEVLVEVSNDGTTNIAAGAAAVTLRVSTSGGTSVFTGTVNNTAIITPGSTEVITFSGVDLSAAGDYVDTAFVTLPLDGTTYNDTIVAGTTTASTLGEIVSTYPLVEDAESTLPVFPFAQIVDGDTQLWGIQTGDYGGPLSTVNTDMPVALVPRAPGTSFYLFDSYNPNVVSIDFVSRLFSNCIKMPAQQLPNPAPVTTVSFWMSRDTLFNSIPAIDSLYLSVSTDKGQTWTRILPGFQRNKASGDPVWEQKLVDVSAYNGQTVQFGFEGASDWGNAIGLDDITISFTGVAPVTLLSFDARKDGSVNKLNWSTSQEVNTRKFIIEHSTDGRSFTEMGAVNAAGNSTTTRSYNFTDLTPVKGINYYRLRMVDNDNAYKYSAIRNVRNLGAADMVIAPNPVLQSMKITMDADKAERATVTVTDLSGKRVLVSTENVVVGPNNFEIPVSHLAKGSYIVMVQLADQTVVRKINKL